MKFKIGDRIEYIIDKWKGGDKGTITGISEKLDGTSNRNINVYYDIKWDTRKQDSWFKVPAEYKLRHGRKEYRNKRLKTLLKLNDYDRQKN